MRLSARHCMLAGRAYLGLSRPFDLLTALLLILAFAGAGWKIGHRTPSADFAVQSPSVRPALTPLASGSTGGSGQQSPDGQFRFSAGFVSASPGQAVHAASIAELRDGGLLAVWFSGSREGAGDVTIQSARMDPTTFQWAAEKTVFDRQQLQRGLWRYVKKLGNPVVARAPDGSLWLWMVNVSLGGWAGSAITWSRSADDGVSWSTPRRLVTSPFLNISTLVKGAPVALADGQISLPVYHEFVTKFGELLRIGADGQVLDKTRIPGSQSSLQPVVLASAPLHAQAYMRSGRAEKIMLSETADAGKTWTPARPTGWPNPDSALAGVVTTSGLQWLALNPMASGRESLALLQASAAAGFDGSQPWMVEQSAAAGVSVAAFERLLGDELAARGSSNTQAQAYVSSAVRQLCNHDRCSQEFSYPYLLQTRDGVIHLVYTWHRTRIKHVRFDPQQSGLMAPTVATKDAVTH